MAMTAAEFREWMDVRGYSIRGLARALGISPTTVQRYRQVEGAVPPMAELALRQLEQDASTQ